MREKHQRKEIKRKIPMNSYKHKTQRKVGPNKELKFEFEPRLFFYLVRQTSKKIGGRVGRSPNQ